MTAALHLAGEEDLERLLPMIAARQAADGVEQDEETRRKALIPLLKGSPHGAVWLIGPRRAPVGYIALSFGWSVEAGGMEGTIRGFHIREGVRGRGMGTEVLRQLVPTLREAGVRALHAPVPQGNLSARRLLTRRGFALRDGLQMMTWRA